MSTWREQVGPTVLGALGLLLTFTAPPHRLDLLLGGLIAVVGSVLWQPRSGPLLIGAALPFYFFSRQLIGPLAVSPPGLMLLASWPAALIRYRTRLSLPRTPYDLPLALFLTAALIGLVISEYPLLSARELRALILEPVLFFWLLAVMPGTSRLALTGWLCTASVVAAAAVLQVLLGIGGTEAEGVRRAQAWYPSPNHLALMLGRAWPLLLAAALGPTRLACVPAVLVGVALLLTFSSGAWLGALASSVAVLLALGYRRFAIPLGVAGVLALAAVSTLAVVGVLPERFNPLRQAGVIRIDLWLSSLAMLRDHPLFGVGLDNFTYLYQQVYIREGGTAEPNLSHPHNWLLHFWLELGLLGLIAFLWLVARFWQLARLRGGWLAAGLIGAMTATLVHGLIDQSYFLVDLAFLFWLFLIACELPRRARAPVHVGEEHHR